MSYVCNNCYDGEELVRRELHFSEENIIYNINKWKELNKNKKIPIADIPVRILKDKDGNEHIF